MLAKLKPDPGQLNAEYVQKSTGAILEPKISVFPPEANFEWLGISLASVQEVLKRTGGHLPSSYHELKRRRRRCRRC
jgi:hypothetical protein